MSCSPCKTYFVLKLPQCPYTCPEPNAVYFLNDGSNKISMYVTNQHGKYFLVNAPTPIPPQQHNNLQGLQGGSDGEYYHLTQAQLTAILQFLNSEATGLVSIGNIEEDGLDLTYENVVWKVQGVQYEVNIQEFNIDAAADGYYRTDIIYGDSSGQLILLEGTESQTNPITPSTPVGTALISVINVFGDTVQIPPDVEIPTLQQVLEAGRTGSLEGGGGILMTHYNGTDLAAFELNSDTATQLTGKNIALIALGSIDITPATNTVPTTNNGTWNLATNVNGTYADETGTIDISSELGNFVKLDPSPATSQTISGNIIIESGTPGVETTLTGVAISQVNNGVASQLSSSVLEFIDNNNGGRVTISADYPITEENILLLPNTDGTIATEEFVNSIIIPQSNLVNYDVAEVEGLLLDNNKHNAFPLTIQTIDNDVITFYREAVGHIDENATIKMMVSKDQGENYAAPVSVTTADGASYSVGISATGRIVLFYIKSTTLEVGYIYTDDKGATWSDFVEIVNEGERIYPYGKVKVIGNNELLMTFYSELGSSDVYVMKSSDNAVTWGSPIPVITSGSVSYNETTNTYLMGNVVVGHIRQDPSGPLTQVISFDNADNWTTQGELNIDYPSNTAPESTLYTEANGDKYVALFWGNRNPARSIVGAVCSVKNIIDGNIVWEELDSLRIPISEVVGDLGYPTVINPKGGSRFLVTYYIADSDTPVANSNLYHKTVFAAATIDIDISGKANLLGGNFFNGKQSVNTNYTFATISAYQPSSIIDDYVALLGTDRNGLGVAAKSSTIQPTDVILTVGRAVNPETLVGFVSDFQILGNGNASFKNELAVPAATLLTSAVNLGQLQANSKIKTTASTTVNTIVNLATATSYRLNPGVTDVTLPPLSGNAGVILFFVNNTGTDVNVNSNAGASDLWSGGANVNTVLLTEGSIMRILHDGTDWTVL